MRSFGHKSDLVSVELLHIPPLKSPMGWREVRIHECAERLVPLSTLDPDRIVVDARYYKEGYPHATKECYARETVARLLCEASKALPPRWKIVVFDAWRPLAVQQQLFERYKTKLRSDYPEATDDALIHEAQKYVSLPSSNPASPSPHVTGGAIDLSVSDDNHRNLEMGTEFDSFDDRSHTAYYQSKLEREGELAPQELIWLRNRSALFHILTRVGFTNYPQEWWHFDYGNQFWARIKGLKAIYGIASLNEGES